MWLAAWACSSPGQGGGHEGATDPRGTEAPAEPRPDASLPVGQDAEAPGEAGVFSVVFSLPGVDDWFRRHEGNASLPPDTAWVLTRVHTAPRESAALRGTLRAVTRRRTRPDWPGPYTAIVLDYAPAGAAPVVWREDLGDWGYGIWLFVRRRAGSWVRLPSDPFGADAWVRVGGEGGGLFGEVQPLDGQLVVFEAGVRAAGGVPMPEQAYAVIRADSVAVEVRPEVPSDMPCETTVPPDPPLHTLPRFRIPTDSLFGAGGWPRLSAAYGRGC